MICVECEKIKSYFFYNTRFFIFLPTLDTLAKVKNLAIQNQWQISEHDTYCISVPIEKSQIEIFLLSIYGQLNGPEQANTKITTTDNQMTLDYEAIGRLIHLDVFVNRYKSLWIIDSVEQKNYETWFQPIVDIRKGDLNNPQTFAHEALFRIKDDTGTIIPPAHVFKTATHSDLLFSLDLVARKSAIEHAAKANIHTKIFVNFDPSSIYDPSYCLRSTAAAIASAGLCYQNVVFEVTETHNAKDIQHLRGILAFYRKAGFGVALDDIGAGWSGLNLMNALMPDYIKIDMELIRDIDISPSQQNIVKHLIASAKENGIKVIAEGIETMAEAECLEQMNADYLQGFLFGKPELFPQPMLNKPAQQQSKTINL